MILSTIAQALGTAGLLVATPVTLPAECKITQTPVINIRPVTKEIEYDVSKTSIELNAMRSKSTHPHELNTDKTTGGLRHDRPTITTEMKFSGFENYKTNTICMSYNTINVDILLQPKIYIAKEFNKRRCAREVMKHEKKHIDVDRRVMNKYTALMGAAIQKAVDKGGVYGPFPLSQTDAIQKAMSDNIEQALAKIQLDLVQEMKKRQQKIDSPKEYDRVTQYCKKSAKEAMKNQEKELRRQQRRR